MRQQVNSPWLPLKQAVTPYIPVLIRLLLVSVFVEDACSTLLQYRGHVQFYWREFSVPSAPAHFVIAVSAMATFLGAAMLFVQPLEQRGSHLLMLAVAYQQAVYGRHSPVTSGNTGFLLRNLCLLGTLTLLHDTAMRDAARSALPALSPPSDKNGGRLSVVALATRCFMVLLCGEMMDTVPRASLLVMLPIALAVLLGYHSQVMALCLMLFYMVVTLTSKQFWMIDTALERGVMRFEFCQAASIMSGLLLLSFTGPGNLSIDSRMKKS